MKSHFELSPAEYEARRQGHLQRRRVALVGADVTAHAREGDQVVELGCGPGDVLAALAAERPDVWFIGVDVDGAMIAHANEAHAAGNVAFRAVDIADTPIAERARVVFGIDVLHHVHALDRFALSVARILVPGGIWTVIEPNGRNPYIWLHQELMRRAGLDEAHFPRAPFARAVDGAGLRIIKSSTAFLVPGSVRSVPRPVARAESMLERVPLLGGSVVYRVSTA